MPYQTDSPYIPQNFSARHMEGKAECKRQLQEELGLEVNPDVPLAVMVRASLSNARLIAKASVTLTSFLIRLSKESLSSASEALGTLQRVCA